MRPYVYLLIYICVFVRVCVLSMPSVYRIRDEGIKDACPFGLGRAFYFQTLQWVMKAQKFMVYL